MKALFVGETYSVLETHMKGVDSFFQTRYVNESGFLQKALEEGGIAVDHMPAHEVPDSFPYELEALKQYGCIIISDVGANSFQLGTETTMHSRIMPDRLKILAEYVGGGGGLAMIGGYMSFGGIEGKACYAGTSMESLLPVEIQRGDDRYEAPAGVEIQIDAPDHPVFRGIPVKWPSFLGYNRLKAKPGALLASHAGNAFIAAWDYGDGRSLAFASDCAPHWGPLEFVNWDYYGRFWINVAKYLAQGDA